MIAALLFLILLTLVWPGFVRGLFALILWLVILALVWLFVLYGLCHWFDMPLNDHTMIMAALLTIGVPATLFNIAAEAATDKAIAKLIAEEEGEYPEL